MKKQNLILLIFISSILFNPLSLLSQVAPKPAAKEYPIKWYSFEEAYALVKKQSADNSKKKQKKVFVDMYTDWCGWCKKMDAETFANPVIAEYMSKNFYCVKFDAERRDTVVIDGQTFVNPNPTGKRSTHKLAVELLRGKLSYPSFVVLNEKGQSLTVLAGYQNAIEFEKVLNWFGSDAYLKTPFEDYKVGFQGKVK
jgi:thioredoxin-related protein